MRTVCIFCGGSILNKDHILTAANCIVGDNGRVKFQSGDVLAALGAYKSTITPDMAAGGATVIPISEYIPHPAYTGVFHVSKEGS